MSALHTVITLFLAVAFLFAGLSKASGSNAGLSGTRDVGFPDGLARLVGIFETLASCSLFIGFALENTDLKLYGFVIVWFIMAGLSSFTLKLTRLALLFQPCC